MLVRHPAFLAVTGAFCVFLVTLGGIVAAIVSARTVVADALGDRLTVRIVSSGDEQTIPLAGVRCRIRPSTGMSVESTTTVLSNAEVTAKYFRAYDSYEISVRSGELYFQSEAPFAQEGDTIRFENVPGAVSIMRPFSGEMAEVEATLNGTLSCRAQQ